MKRIFCVIVTLVLLCTLTACAGTSDALVDNAGQNSGEQSGSQLAEVWGITLTADKVTSTGMTLVCTRKTGNAQGQLETGSAYWIEKKEGGRWVEVPSLTEPCWDMMAQIIPDKESLKWELDWTWLYGELSAGDYRLCKTVVDFRGPGDSESRNYCAEFTIK